MFIIRVRHVRKQSQILKTCSKLRASRWGSWDLNPGFCLPIPCCRPLIKGPPPLDLAPGLREWERVKRRRVLGDPQSQRCHGSRPTGQGLAWERVSVGGEAQQSPPPGLVLSLGKAVCMTLRETTRRAQRKQSGNRPVSTWRGWSGAGVLSTAHFLPPASKLDPPEGTGAPGPS